MLGVLQVAQAGRVGGGDVDDEGVRVLGKLLGASRVGLGGGFERDVAVLSDVHEKRCSGRLQLAEAFGDGVRAVVVEPKTVDQRAARGVTKEARPRIARLRVQRHRADFDEAEAECGKERHHHRVFIESRGDADRIAKRQVPQLHRRRRRRAEAPDQPQRDRNFLHAADLLDRPLVRRFRVEPEEQFPRCRVDHASSFSARVSGDSTLGSLSLARCNSGITRTSSGP